MDRMKIKQLAKLGSGGLLGLFLLVQLIPVPRVNPPVESDVAAPPEVASVLRRACYDCHSNETAWPWYSRVAPVSWLVAKDVREGREALNYSTWGRYSREERAEKLEETWEDVAEGEMPLRVYTLAHPGARLTGADRQALRAWATGGRAAGEERPSERQ